jgi:copper chaperone
LRKIRRMEKYQFKTNINCSGCIAKVTPYLSGNQQIKHWDVDINNPRKILTVETEDLTRKEIEAIIRMAGFNIESI